MRHALITLGLLALFGCSHQNNPTNADEYIVDCTVNGSQFASDESFAKFIEAEASQRVTADDCKSPELLGPSSGATLSAGAPPLFLFNPIHTCGAQGPTGSPRRHAVGTSRARPMWLSVLKFAADLLEGTAEAHCGAFSGENYLFRITRAGDSTPLYRALLSVTSFQPDPAIWRRALSGRNGQTVSVTIERATFSGGSINEGPYVQSPPYSFPVGP
jgi:hypothetical protein